MPGYVQPETGQAKQKEEKALIWSNTATSRKVCTIRSVIRKQPRMALSSMKKWHVSQIVSIHQIILTFAPQTTKFWHKILMYGRLEDSAHATSELGRTKSKTSKKL